jgi:hypothetical protein
VATVAQCRDREVTVPSLVMAASAMVQEVEFDNSVSERERSGETTFDYSSLHEMRGPQRAFGQGRLSTFDRSRARLSYAC